jgi:hypothetical protein
MMSRARRPGRRRDPAASSRRADCPAPVTDHHGPVIWAWLETVSLPRISGRPVRIVVNLAGAALFAQASVQSCLRTHSLVGDAFLIEQAWFVIAFLVRLRPSALGVVAGLACNWRRSCCCAPGASSQSSGTRPQAASTAPATSPP